MTQAPPAPSTVTQTAASPGTEAVRLATTMTGGVSLAVWMGGVARELDLLTQASQWRRVLAGNDKAGPRPARGAPSADDVAGCDLYARLLELLDIVVDVDILSGTSAGGINAVMLAYARARDGHLGRLRDIWLDLGALTDLLREPSDADVPSLLYGDRRMLSGLADKLPELDGNGGVKDPPSTTLYVTTTLLTGETSRITDSLGTLVQDEDRRGVFTFTEEDLANGSAAVVEALAVAGRSTASFPGAFEPGFVPCASPVATAGGVPARPAMDEYIPITRDHWVADGGLLDNQPLDVVLQRIFDRPTSRPVRRVLLFVVPTSGSAADLVAAAPVDDAARPYGLVDGLLKEFSAMASQSISSSLRAIVEHNDQFVARRDLRLQVAGLANRLDKERLLTVPLLTDYVRRESGRQARPLVTALLRLLSTWPAPSASSAVKLPQAWTTNLQPGGDAEETCRTAVRAALEAAWAPAQVGGLPATGEEFAGYGRAAFDNAKSLALALLRCAYDASTSEAEERRLAELGARVHHDVDLDDRPKLTSLVRTAAETAARAPAGTLADAARAVAGQWVLETTVPATSWESLATVLVEAVPFLRPLAKTAPADSDLATYVAYFGLGGDSSPTAADVATRLFDLAAVDKALTPLETGPYQKLELVQLSADTRSLLTPKRDTAESKLTGLQLHHFGAFYKRSWRANDWMWGRLDAAGWLVHALLEPKRLRKVAERHAAEGHRVDWALGELRGFGAPLPQGDRTPDGPPTEADLRDELAFLDAPSPQLPRSLPRTSMWLAAEWQRLIAAAEIPKLADEILGAPGQKVDRSPSASRSWAQSVREKGADPATLLGSCPVPDETFATDKGSPLMVHTVAKAAATITAAISSVQQLPRPVRPAVTTAHTIALGGYRSADVTSGRPRYLILAGLAMLVAGVAVSIQSAQVVGAIGLAVAAVGGYVLTFGVWQLSSRLLAALAALTVFGGFAALALPAARQFLFGDPSHGVDPKANVGWVGEHLHWLATAWWHPLLAVGVLILLIVVAGAAFSLPKRLRPVTGSRGS